MCTYADNALWSDQLDELISDCALAIALSISLEVSKVTNVTGLIGRSTVGLSVRVDYSLSAQSPRYPHVYVLRTVGSSGGASVGVVTEGVDVHATLGIWVVASDVPCDGSWGRLGGLLESDGSSNLGVTSDGSNCTSKVTWSAKV